MGRLVTDPDDHCHPFILHGRLEIATALLFESSTEPVETGVDGQ
jgi:hypothetical protein